MLDNHNRFACDMYQQLGKEPGNLFFSPSSIWTALAMTYTVYFKGSWLRPFNADSTQAANFRLTAAESIPVPTMHQLGEFAYNSVDDVQILELLYGDVRLSMLILLPTEVEGLAKLEAQLTIDNLQRWTQPGFRSQKVNVYLPKFKSTSQFELNAVLAADHLHQTPQHHIVIADDPDNFSVVDDRGTHNLKAFEEPRAVANVHRRWNA